MAGEEGRRRCVRYQSCVASAWSGGTTAAALGVDFPPPILSRHYEVPVIVFVKPNISVTGHYLEDRLAKNWAGVDYGSTEGSTRVTAGDVKPLHFLELVANTSSWNDTK